MKTHYLSLIAFLFSIFTSNSQDISVITQQKTKGAIEVLAFSNDGNLLASGGKGDFDLKVWDLNSGKVIGTLKGHTDDITAIQFNNSGNKIISTGDDGKLIVWDILKWTISDSITTNTSIKSLVNGQSDEIYTADEDGHILSWEKDDLNKQDTIYTHPKSISELHLAGQQLVFSDAVGMISMLDILKKTIVISSRISPLGILDFGYNSLDNNLVVATKDGKVSICAIDDLSIKQTIKTGSLLNTKFTVHPSNGTFVVATAAKTLKLMNTKGETLSEFKGKTEADKSYISGICISPDGTLIASTGTRYTESLKGRKANSTIKLWDCNRGIIHQTLEGKVNPILTFDFNPVNQKLVFLGEDNALTFWTFNSAEKFGDYTLPKAKREIPPKSKKIDLKKGKRLLDKARDIASGNLEDIRKNTDVKGIGAVVLKRTFAEKDIISYSNDGNYLFTKLKKDEIRQYNLQNRKPELLRTIFSYQPVINGFLVNQNDQLMAVYGSGDSAVSIIDLTTGEFIKKLPTPGPENFKLLFEAKSAAFSPDGKHLAVCFNTSKTYVWNTSTWRLEFENTLLGNIGYAKGAYTNFTAQGEYLVVNTITGVKLFNTRPFGLYSEGTLSVKGHSLPINKPCNYAATIKDDFLYFEHLATNKVVKSIPVKPYMVSHVSAKADGKIGITLINGQFFILNPDTGEDEIMLVSEGDNSIIKTHENYYKVNKEGYELVTFRIGNKAYPFEQFDAIYNRPDLVLKKLGCTDANLMTLYKKAHDKRLSKIGIASASASDLTRVPSCKIENKNDIEAITKATNVNLNLAFKDQSGLASYNIWVNNVPVYGKKGKNIKGTAVKAQASLELVHGVNKIQIASRNKQGIESLLETVYVENVSDKPAQRLYLLTIGTSKYLDSKYNLNYAAKDASDLSTLFSANQSGFYEKVLTKNIANEAVTTEQVKSLKAFVSEAGINDVVIIFVAGHGVLDESFDYYFATHPMVFNNPKLKGLVYEDLESLLDGIAAKKKILIMDTCHSGEIDKEDVFFAEEDEVKDENVSFRSAGGLSVESKTTGISPSKVMNELFNDLRRGTGATVISSAGGAEYALESDEWKNGLFSYCMLRGLKNGYADLNGDGEIYLTELQTYTVEKVKALSNGKQIPNSRIQNLELDFRIW
ncbi:MAG: caspase family protein [Crocinitomicaceae bacterium]